MIHLPKIAKKSRPPRMLKTPYQLGHTFSEKPQNKVEQREGVETLLNYALDEEAIETVKKWK